MAVEPRDYLTASANMDEARERAAAAVAKVARAQEFLASAVADFDAISAEYGATVTFINSQSNQGPWSDLKSAVAQLQSDFSANRTRAVAKRDAAQAAG